MLKIKRKKKEERKKKKEKKEEEEEDRSGRRQKKAEESKTVSYDKEVQDVLIVMELLMDIYGMSSIND